MTLNAAIWRKLPYGGGAVCSASQTLPIPIITLATDPTSSVGPPTRSETITQTWSPLRRVCDTGANPSPSYTGSLTAARGWCIDERSSCCKGSPIGNGTAPASHS